MTTLTALWIAWCTLHSLLISRAAHGAAKQILGSYFQVYRLLYVGFSLLSLVPVLWYQFSLQQQILFPSNPLIRGLQVFLLLYAGFMFWAGVRVYDMDYFLGLNQWQNRFKNNEVETFPFHTDGVLNHVRHPWYSGGIAFLWGIGSITDVYVLTRIILTVYILVGTGLEESRIKKELGSPYREYCRNVPMLIPWKFLSILRNR